MESRAFRICGMRDRRMCGPPLRQGRFPARIRNSGAGDARKLHGLLLRQDRRHRPRGDPPRASRPSRRPLASGLLADRFRRCSRWSRARHTAPRPRRGSARARTSHASAMPAGRPGRYLGNRNAVRRDDQSDFRTAAHACRPRELPATSTAARKIHRFVPGERGPVAARKSAISPSSKRPTPISPNAFDSPCNRGARRWSCERTAKDAIACRGEAVDSLLHDSLVDDRNAAHRPEYPGWVARDVRDNVTAVRDLGFVGGPYAVVQSVRVPVKHEAARGEAFRE